MALIILGTVDGYLSKSLSLRIPLTVNYRARKFSSRVSI